jgi:hypothetical protein
MLNFATLKTSKNLETTSCRRITILKKPYSPESTSPKTIIGRRSIRGPRSKLRRG